MKKITVLILLIFGVISAYSQSDSLLLRYYEQKILENSKLKNDLQTVKQDFIDLSNAYKKDTVALQKQIKDLHKELSSQKQKVTDLNKNKIKEERDNLRMKVDSLNAVISKQNHTIADKEKQISSEKANAKTSADIAKNDGRAEVLASIANSYKNRPFDDLIKSSTRETVTRNMQLLGNNTEIKPVLNDLHTYFSALELLSEKFDVVQIKNAQTQLSQIKRQSEMLDVLKEDVEFYQDFSTALILTISKLDDLDKRKSAVGDDETQKLKFNEIVTILTDYMYNYSDYGDYLYLSDIVLEIINRKRSDADAGITDLLIKL